MYVLTGIYTKIKWYKGSKPLTIYSHYSNHDSQFENRPNLSLDHSIISNLTLILFFTKVEDLFTCYAIVFSAVQTKAVTLREHILKSSCGRKSKTPHQIYISLLPGSIFHGHLWTTFFSKRKSLDFILAKLPAVGCAKLEMCGKTGCQSCRGIKSRCILGECFLCQVVVIRFGVGLEFGLVSLKSFV